MDIVASMIIDKCQLYLYFDPLTWHLSHFSLSFNTYFTLILLIIETLS